MTARRNESVFGLAAGLLVLLMAIPLRGEIPPWINVAGAAIVTLGILVTLGPHLFRPASSPAAGAETGMT